jgi:histidinol dehydrogenase
MIRPTRLNARALREAEGRRDRFLEELDRVQPTVARVLSTVRREGDAALRRYSRQWDRWSGPIEVPESTRRECERRTPPALRRALGAAARNILRFHEQQRPRPARRRLPGGSEISLEFVPVRRLGLYAPGGRAPYPSTVLMGGLAARAAGVGSVYLATPGRPESGPAGLDPAIATAARLAGIERVFRVGGASAIGAMAYGTRTVPRVDKIVGPGNLWVTAAKRAVLGVVGIDALAGPSECLLVVDRTAPVDVVAAEAAAQVEHGPSSSTTIVALGESYARRVAAALGRSPSIPDPSRIQLYWTPRAEEAHQFADSFAPETLFVAVERLAPWQQSLPTCGAAFFGPYSSVPFGDYVSGTNHILPVLGSARYTGGLSVYDCGHWVSRQRITPRDARSLAEVGVPIALAEGMVGHAAAQRIRMEIARTPRGPGRA